MNLRFATCCKSRMRASGSWVGRNERGGGFRRKRNDRSDDRAVCRPSGEWGWPAGDRSAEDSRGGGRKRTCAHFAKCVPGANALGSTDGLELQGGRLLAVLSGWDCEAPTSKPRRPSPKKLRVPSSKESPSSNSHRKPCAFEHAWSQGGTGLGANWSLEFLWKLELGAWDLVLLERVNYPS